MSALDVSRSYICVFSNAESYTFKGSYNVWDANKNQVGYYYNFGFSHVSPSDSYVGGCNIFKLSYQLDGTWLCSDTNSDTSFSIPGDGYFGYWSWSNMSGTYLIAV